MTKLAVLDIGTNSIHLVLAEVEPDSSYKILDRFKDMTRLGDGAFKNRRLSNAAMARGLEVIRTLATLASNKGYERIEAVATSAVREARNGGEFLEEVARRTGLTARVVTGQEEARLIYLGVRHSMDLSDRPALVVDVGGGSVELIAGNRDTMVQGQSLKLGAIRLKDLYLEQDPPTKPMLRDMGKAIDAQLQSALKHFKTKQFDRLVGTSGMIGNLAEIIYLRRTGQPIPQLNLATVTLKEVAAVERLLIDARPKARLAIPGLDPKRVDTLLPATTVVRSLMEHLDQDQMTISDKAIRDGLIYDFIERNREGLRAEREIPNVRRRNVIYLARRCQYPKKYAAILHDVGYLINSRQHHKHAYYLIKNSDLYGLTADEIEMIANIARYHRRALPQAEHVPLKILSARDRRRLEALSALLRIADGLDRSHFSVIQDLEVKLGKPVTITLRTAGDPELEIWAARGRSDLFEKVFKRPVQFVAKASGGAPA